MCNVSSLSTLIASLSDIAKFETFTNPDEVNSYLSLNVSSPLALTAGILQLCPCRPGLRWSVVNLSSMFALQALPSWVLYCTAKAARNMMFSVLAKEQQHVKVLSYSPGIYTLYIDQRYAKQLCVKVNLKIIENKGEYCPFLTGTILIEQCYYKCATLNVPWPHFVFTPVSSDTEKNMKIKGCTVGSKGT